MGEDAHASCLNRYTAKDAIGLTLNYFGNDYAAINGMPFPGYSGSLPSGAYRPLYNGNISSSYGFGDYWLGQAQLQKATGGSW